MTDEIHVQGMRELAEAMDALSEKIKANVMRGAVRAGAKVIQANAKAICPIEGANSLSKYKQTLGGAPGDLQRSIRVSSKIKNDRAWGKVTAGNKKAYYAHMVEFGTTPHQIRPKGAKALFFGGRFSEKIEHPGARKNPFMRVAMDAQASAAAHAVADYIRGRLNKAGIEMPDTGGDDPVQA